MEKSAFIYEVVSVQVKKFPINKIFSYSLCSYLSHAYTYTLTQVKANDHETHIYTFILVYISVCYIGLKCCLSPVTCTESF